MDRLAGNFLQCKIPWLRIELDHNTNELIKDFEVSDALTGEALAVFSDKKSMFLFVPVNRS